MNSKKSGSKLTLRSILISALVILFFVSIIAAYYAMIYSETRQKIIKSGELNSVSSADRIDKYLSKGIDTITLTCYSIDNMLRAEKSQEDIIEFLTNQTSAVMNTTAQDTTGLYGYINGEYVDGTGWIPEDDYVATARPWYTKALSESGRVAVTDPYIDAQTGTVMITFSKTLCDAKSVAAMDFSLDPIQSIVDELSDSDESSAEILLDRKYNVIAHTNKSELGKSYISDLGTFGHALVNKVRTNGEGFFSIRYGGADYIVYTVKLSNDWFCLSVSDATSAFSQLKYALIFTITALLLVVTVLLIIMIQSNKRREQLTKLSVHVVEALAAAIDAKDTYTNGHSGRVAEYAREIGKRFGYNKKQQDEIYMMGLLHDVGKIGIPDAVINKPGKLTDKEFDLIKTHPVIGAQILSKTEELPRMAVGAHWHHERYDGTGYPDGLSGEQIQRDARIIAVADAYDAMTSARSYRSALPQETVRSEIENGRGTQFDPVFADIMLKMIDEDKEYKMKDNS